MEEIYEDEPKINDIINKNKQKQLSNQLVINSEFIDNSNIHPDNAFEVIILSLLLFKS